MEGLIKRKIFKINSEQFGHILGYLVINRTMLIHLFVITMSYQNKGNHGYLMVIGTCFWGCGVDRVKTRKTACIVFSIFML